MEIPVLNILATDGDVGIEGLLMLTAFEGTSSTMYAAAVWPPEVPVIVMGNEPLAAVTPTLIVSVLLLVVDCDENEAVTPLGSPDTERLTEPVKPPEAPTEIVMTLEEAGSTFNVQGEAEREKTSRDGGASASIRLSPTGVPHPVTRSYPERALKEYPLTY